MPERRILLVLLRKCSTCTIIYIGVVDHTTIFFLLIIYFHFLYSHKNLRCQSRNKRHTFWTTNQQNLVKHRQKICTENFVIVSSKSRLPLGKSSARANLLGRCVGSLLRLFLYIPIPHKWKVCTYSALDMGKCIAYRRACWTHT